MEIEHPITLDEKVEKSIKLLKTIGNKEVELCYSGGKDSDVILELAKLAGVNYRAIYKNTTIDPSGTMKHCKRNNVEILHPKINFFTLISQKGFPTFRGRFCCKYLKEYKVMDTAIQGVRRVESTKRKKLYKEPVACRFYGSKKNHVNVYYPILYWTDRDVAEFIKMRNIKCHPLYYENGKFDVNKRLGCIGCPLKSDRGKKDFLNNKTILKAWLKAGLKWWNENPQTGSHRKFESIYDLFIHNIFYESYEDFMLAKTGLFGKMDCKKELENYFQIKL